MADNNDTPTSKIAKQVIREITGRHDALPREKPASKFWWLSIVIGAFGVVAGWLVGYGSLSAKSDASQKAIEKMDAEKLDKSVFEITLNGISQQMIDNRASHDEIRAQLASILSALNKRR